MDLKECFSPWYELNISYDHGLKGCCYFQETPEQWDFNKSLDFQGFWNGPRMQEIRKTVLSNKPVGTGCDRCTFIKYYKENALYNIPYDVNSLQRQNWERAIENHKNSKTVIDTVPIRFYFNFGLACNLNCVMCSQRHLREANSEQIPFEKLLELKEYLLPANEFSIIGGEPLMLLNAKRFVEAVVKDDDYSNILLSFFTNGTLLHNFIDDFKSMKRLNVTISLDSIGEYYERIRRGSKWDLIERNIDLFRSTAKQNNLNWNVHVSSVIMKSSIPRLVDFVDWCIGRDIPVHFVRLMAMDFTQDEDVFNNPDLIKGIANWESIFDSAIEKLTKKGWINGGAYPLQMIKEDFKKII